MIVQPGDTLSELEAASSMTLVELEDGQPAFAVGPEIVEQHTGVLELVFILSDDGFGVVLLVMNADGIDPVLKAACERELRAQGNMPGLQRP